jgi:hypothetical protein
MIKKFNKSFLSDESLCKKLTLSRFKKELNFFDESLSFYLELLDGVQRVNSQKISTEEGVIILLNIRMMRSLFCSNNLIKTGYYNESRVLQRSVHEIHYLCKYFDKNPNSITKWRKGKNIPHEKISNDLNLSKEVKNLYSTFCDHAHPNLPILTDFISQKNRKPDTLNIGPVFIEEEAYTSMFIQLLLIQMIIDNFEFFLQKNNRIKITIAHEKKHDILHKKFFKMIDSWEIPTDSQK